MERWQETARKKNTLWLDDLYERTCVGTDGEKLTAIKKNIMLMR